MSKQEKFDVSGRIHELTKKQTEDLERWLNTRDQRQRLDDDTIDESTDDEMHHVFDGIENDLAELITGLETNPEQQREPHTPPQGFETKVTTQVLGLLGETGDLIKRLQRLEQNTSLSEFRTQFEHIQDLLIREYTALEHSGLLQELLSEETREKRDAIVAKAQTILKNLNTKLQSFEN